jgi:HK97 family phage major capsid protein
MTSKEILEKRAEAGKAIQALSAKANAENRDFTAEEKVNYEKANKDWDDLSRQLEIAKRSDDIAAAMKQPSAAAAVPGRQDSPPDPDQRAAGEHNRATDEGLAFEGWARFGCAKAAPETRHFDAARRVGIDIQSNAFTIRFGSLLTRASRLPNKRAIGDAPQTVTTTGGGYLIPEGFSGMLEKALLMFNPIEAYCTQLVTATGNDIPWPTSNETTHAGAEVAINTTATEQAITLGQVVLKAYKLESQSVLVPFELMQDSYFNMESFIGEVLGERIGRCRAALCVSGAGTTHPTGLAVGATTAATTASASQITNAELLTLLYSVNPAYLQAGNNPAWMFNNATALAIRNMVDGIGRGIWQPDMTGMQPERLHGYPVIMNAAVASIGSGTKPVYFGAFKKFIIRTIGEMRLIRDPYTYSYKDQTFYVAFDRMDCNVLDAGTHPIKYLTCAA